MTTRACLDTGNSLEQTRHGYLYHIVHENKDNMRITLGKNYSIFKYIEKNSFKWTKKFNDSTKPPAI